MKRKMVWFGIPWLAGLFLATACQTSVTVSLLLAAFLLLGAFRLYRRITTGQLLCVGLSAAAAAGAGVLDRGSCCILLPCTSRFCDLPEP